MQPLTLPLWPAVVPDPIEKAAVKLHAKNRQSGADTPATAPVYRQLPLSNDHKRPSIVLDPRRLTLNRRLRNGKPLGAGAGAGSLEHPPTPPSAPAGASFAAHTHPIVHTIRASTHPTSSPPHLQHHGLTVPSTGHQCIPTPLNQRRGEGRAFLPAAKHIRRRDATCDLPTRTGRAWTSRIASSTTFVECTETQEHLASARTAPVRAPG